MLLALVLAQAIGVGNPSGPIFNQPSLMNRLAFFEAFPTGGAGAGAACPLPNWLLQSDDISTSWTATFGGGGSAPTITINQAAGPFGGTTADRLQTSACVADGAFSVVYQGLAQPAGPWTGSVYLKGTSGSGTVAVYEFDATAVLGTWTSCAYTATDWTRCSVTRNYANTTQRLAIGCNFASAVFAGSSNTGAADVLVSAVMQNVGSTAAPYVATTTVAVGYSPTSAQGSALTFTRASTGMCTKTSTGGLATTLIASGDLVLMPSNQSRVEYDGAGTLGLLVEATRTSVALRSEAIDNATWSKLSFGGPAAPTVTADFAVSPDGATTAERVQFAATTGAQYSIIGQTGFAAGAYSESFYIKGNGTSGTLGGYTAPATACFSCSYNSTTWTRCTPAVSGAAATQFFIGNDSNDCGGSPGAADVLIWGEQFELGAYATSYIPTTTIAVARAVDDPTFTLPAFTVSTPWSIAATVSSAGAASSPRYHGTLGPTGLASYVTDSFSLVADSTQVTPNNYSTGLSATSCGTLAGCRAATYHDGTLFNGCKDGTCAAGVARAWTNLANVTTYKPGMYSTANGVIDGVISRICFDNVSATRCR